MAKLRHAGSPVQQPEKLSRAKQDALLMESFLVARIVVWQERIRCHCKVTDELADLRAALRLDDPVLDDLIAQGAHRGPWRSPTDAERVS